MYNAEIQNLTKLMDLTKLVLSVNYHQLDSFMNTVYRSKSIPVRIPLNDCFGLELSKKDYNTDVFFLKVLPYHVR